jgi:hypothetical protein
MSRKNRWMVALGMCAIMASVGASVVQPVPTTPPTTIAREAEAVGASVRRIRGRRPVGAARSAGADVVIAWCLPSPDTRTRTERYGDDREIAA